MDDHQTVESHLTRITNSP